MPGITPWAAGEWPEGKEDVGTRASLSRLPLAAAWLSCHWFAWRQQALCTTGFVAGQLPATTQSPDNLIISRLSPWRQGSGQAIG